MKQFVSESAMETRNKGILLETKKISKKKRDRENYRDARKETSYLLRGLFRRQETLRRKLIAQTDGLEGLADQVKWMERLISEVENQECQEDEKPINIINFKDTDVSHIVSKPEELNDLVGPCLEFVKHRNYNYRILIEARSNEDSQTGCYLDIRKGERLRSGPTEDVYRELLWFPRPSLEKAVTQSPTGKTVTANPAQDINSRAKETTI
jgi:hypothetical protein